MTKNCQACDTVTRAVTLPVVGPVDETWDNVNDALRVAFRLSTDLANWAVHHLFRLDTPGAARCPEAVAKACLRGAVVKEFPGWSDLSPGVIDSTDCMFRGVQRKYVQQRFAVQVRHESSLLTYRYPYPFPVHNRSWSVAFAAGPWPGKAPVVTLALPVLGRVALRLDRGPEFGRQLVMVRQLIDGRAMLKAKLALIDKRLPKQRRKELRGAAERDVIGAGFALPSEAAVYRDRKGRLLVKLVGKFPRKDRGPATNAAFVHTDPNAVLVVEINGRRVDVTNGDHIRRVIARHRAFRQRASEDKKREKRMDRRQRAGLNKYVADRCGKQNDLLDTYVKQVAAQVARMCGRQGVGLVAYDDANREYMRGADADDLPFPWHALKERLKQLLVGEMGCGWIDGQFAHLAEPEGRSAWLAAARATAVVGSRALAHKRRKGSHPAVTTTSKGSPSRPAKTKRGSARP